jgi:predicted hotdog family 3-hydroxylacyl-ACP dehydratase
MDKTPNTERHQTSIRVEQKLGAHAGILQQRKDIRVEQKLGVHAGILQQRKDIMVEHKH